MKSATAEDVPQQWHQILQWVAAGEEVRVTQKDKVVAPPFTGHDRQPGFSRALQGDLGRSAIGNPA